MTETLFRDESCSEPPAGVDAGRPARSARDGHDLGLRREALAGQRREQLALTVPGDPRDPHNLSH